MSLAHIAFIGCGHMGQALLSRWLTVFGGRYRYTLLSHHPEKVQGYVSYETVTWKYAGSVLEDPPDVFLIAVKPQDVKKAIAPYQSEEKALFVTIAAGKPMGSYGLLGRDFVRLMPNMPVSIGKGLVAAYPQKGLSERRKQDLVPLLEALGEVIWLPQEEHFHAVTALSGSGPAYVFYLVEILIQRGIEQGFSEEMAQKLATQTVIGSAAYLASSAEKADSLRAKITSKGGTTEAALSFLQNARPDNLDSLFSKAIESAVQRSKCLASSF